MTNSTIDASGALMAIAALDAYNQSYNIDKIRSGMTNAGTQIGPLTVTPLSDLGISSTKLDEWASAGFSAVAYKLNGSVGNLAAGTTVIAFRGTDDIPGDVPDWSIWFAQHRRAE